MWQVSGFMTISGSRSSPSLYVINCGERNRWRNLLRENLKLPQPQAWQEAKEVTSTCWEVKIQGKVFPTYLCFSFMSLVHTLCCFYRLNRYSKKSWKVNELVRYPAIRGTIDVLTLLKRLPSKEIGISSGGVDYLDPYDSAVIYLPLWLKDCLRSVFQRWVTYKRRYGCLRRQNMAEKKW